MSNSQGNISRDFSSEIRRCSLGQRKRGKNVLAEQFRSTGECLPLGHSLTLVGQFTINLICRPVDLFDLGAIVFACQIPLLLHLLEFPQHSLLYPEAGGLLIGCFRKVTNLTTLNLPRTYALLLSRAPHNAPRLWELKPKRTPKSLASSPSLQRRNSCIACEYKAALTWVRAHIQQWNIHNMLCVLQCIHTVYGSSARSGCNEWNGQCWSTAEIGHSH